jgi:S1-C subfamily serine protease
MPARAGDRTAMNPRLLAAAALAALALTACGGSHRAAAPATTNAGSSGVALQTAFRRVVQDISPSVVQVRTSEGLGSGIVYDDKRDIVTNAHVVGSADAFKVTLASGREVDADLVGRWAPGDLAVIRARSGDLKPATFADSGKLAVGDIVMAVGNPLGLRSSVTQGIVSSLGRTVSEGSNGVTLPSAIQTSAAINPGNSGGALVDLRGQVVGIPTLAALDPELGGSAAPGIGFAIPSSTVTSIAKQLIQTGKVTESGRAALGIDAATVVGGGVAVVSAEPGGAAAKAGLQRGDIIVSVAGRPTPSVSALTSVLAGLEPGRQVSVEVRRADGGRQTVKVTLGQLGG